MFELPIKARPTHPANTRLEIGFILYVEWWSQQLCFEPIWATKTTRQSQCQVKTMIIHKPQVHHSFCILSVLIGLLLLASLRISSWLNVRPPFDGGLTRPTNRHSNWSNGAEALQEHWPWTRNPVHEVRDEELCLSLIGLSSFAVAW